LTAYYSDEIEAAFAKNRCDQPTPANSPRHNPLAENRGNGSDNLDHDGIEYNRTSNSNNHSGIRQ